jgi:DNA-binding NarL/FixJ family response regulator
VTRGFDVRVATTGDEGVRVAREYAPDLVLVDVGLPDRSGIVVGKEILAELGQEPPPASGRSNGGSNGKAEPDSHEPEGGAEGEEPGVRHTHVVAVTALDDARLANEALQAGFHGYLMKDTNVSQLLSAIDAVLAGQVVLPSRIARSGSGIREQGSDVRLLGQQLTRRELEVLELLTEGANSREISGALGVAPNTVRTHVQSILFKLQVHSRLEAAAFAVRHDLVRPRPRS